MTSNQLKINDLKTRTDRVITDRHAEGTMGLYASSSAWAQGKIALKVVTNIPEEITCAQAKELGWALYMLGKYGSELDADADHEIGDDYFMD